MIKDTMLDTYYNLSEDYKELYDLVKDDKAILCYGQEPDERFKDLWRPIHMKQSDNVIYCGTLGMSYFTLYGWEIERFTSEFEAFEWYCEFYKIKWIKKD